MTGILLPYSDGARCFDMVGDDRWVLKFYDGAMVKYKELRGRIFLPLGSWIILALYDVPFLELRCLNSV